jgi:hypothetical protein
MDKNELKQVQLAIHDLINKEDYGAALPLINAVLEHYPNDDATLNFMGYIHLMGDQPALAYQYFRRALQESPSNKALWTSLGRACHEMDNFEDAITYFLKSAELDNNYALAYSNAAASFIQTSEWKNAEEVCKLALEADPNDKNAQMNLAHAYLAQGKWKDGWKHWGESLNSKFRKEWHYKDESRWEGQAYKNIVIYGEQGLGDEIFYADCINDAIAISNTVHIDCDPKLKGLFQRSFPDAFVHGTRQSENVEWLDKFELDHRCAIGGLPEFFRHDNKDFPRKPYLYADPERAIMWRALFDSWKGKVIGIATHGGNKRTNEKGRELTAEDLKPLLDRDDITLVSLDYKNKHIDGVKYFPFATQSDDYDDTAALISELDEVIGVNTTALHCSAALGVKTTCLVPKYHQWRYAQPSMPWYRHMSLKYQDDKTWKEVIESINI